MTATRWCGNGIPHVGHTLVLKFRIWKGLLVFPLGSFVLFSEEKRGCKPRVNNPRTLGTGHHCFKVPRLYPLGYIKRRTAEE